MRFIGKHESIIMADESVFYGTWKIVECVSLAGTVEPTGIEGTVFTLDESGDVSWKVSEEAESMPFFSCETYEVCMNDPAILKFFGTFAGHVIEFKVEISDDLMLLTYDRCCMLQCQKISSSDPKDDVPFSFLGALEERYFSDLTIKAANDKEFKVHKTIMGLTVPEVNWSRTPTPLSGLPEEVLCTILYYQYCECLPKGLSEETARACVKAVSKMPGFTKFSRLCDTFLKNTALRQQITSLVEDMHACADKIIDLFSGKVTASGEPQSTSVHEESLMANPAKLCYVVKQALREAAIAGAKLLILCDLFSRRKGELSREERHEIIKYAKSRLPVFMSQLRRFLEVCKHHSASLTASQRHEIATYLVPEIETTLDTISTFVVETKTALEHVINISSAQEKGDKHEKHKKANVGDVLGKTLRNALHMRELMKLKLFHEKTTQSFHNLMRKKENFSLMSQEEKIRSVAKYLEQLIDEVPLFLVRIEELMSALDEKVTWREWKYLFKLGTSKVAWVLSKFQAHKLTVESLITKACDMVHRDQFHHSMTMLGLLASSAPTTEAATGAVSRTQPNTKYAQLSAVESLCQPPYARDSDLAHKALELLKNEDKTDMVFDIIVVQDSGDVVIDHTSGEPLTQIDKQKEFEIFKVPAHCVIIAARCSWFRRALLSGMRESIDKKITVHDTNPELFKLFLEYLYRGQLDMDELVTEQLADLMTLSDRYELRTGIRPRCSPLYRPEAVDIRMDCLKSLCEDALKHHIDEDSALLLLSLADQFNAQALRECALHFVVEHTSLLQTELFEDLPRHLQTEVEEIVSWQDLEPQARNLSAHSHTETPSSVSSTSDMDDLMNALELRHRQLYNDHSTSSSSDELQFVEDSSRLESCLEQLRHIVGDTVSREELVRVSLAADYDVNRALNFFFSSS